MGRRTDSRDLKSSIAIVGDGYVEKYYFENLKIQEEDEKKWFQILPKLPEDSGGFDKAINRAIDLVKQGTDMAYAIVDIDKILSDGKFQEFKQKEKEVEKVNEEYEGKICLCYCNPCFEYWLLLHFKYTAKRFGNCGSVEAELSSKIGKYEKTKDFHSKNDLYSLLRPKLETGIKNSERSETNYKRVGDDDHHPISTIHKLFHYLKIGVEY